MKATADHGYLYPECNPPFVKDTGDLPFDLKQLAEAVDDDVTAINAAAAVALNPPAGLLTLTAAEALGPGVFLKFNNLTTVATNVGAIADGPNARFIAPTAGLYFVTGTATTSSAPTGVLKLGFRINGALFRAESILPNTAAGNAAAINSVSMTIAKAGDVLDMVQFQPGAGNVTYQSAAFGIYRMVAT